MTLWGGGYRGRCLIDGNTPARVQAGVPEWSKGLGLGPSA